MKEWRRRVGVEPTQVRSRALAYGFEDRAHHRTGCASAKSLGFGIRALQPGD